MVPSDARRSLRQLVALALLVVALAAAALAFGAGDGTVEVAHAGVKRSPPCQAAFPDARRKSIGKTTWFNRQESVRMVVCYRFGLEPSADFPISWSMACGVVGKVIGKRAPKLALFEEGACSGVELAGQPKEPTKYIGIACSWAATLLGSGLGSAGCTLAPPTGRALGSIFESKHELDVAIDVIQRGKCIKNSPTHFGSSWLAEDCADGDKGFNTLPVYRPRSGPTPTGSSGGASGGGSGSVGSGPGGGPNSPTVSRVKPLGPTTGPSGFGIAIATPPCSSGLTLFADGSFFYHYLYAGDHPEESAWLMTDGVTENFLSVGRHQISFSCIDWPESFAEWTDPGFEIEITEPPRHVLLASSEVAQGESLVYESGTSNGPSPCPVLSGFEPFQLRLFLERSGSGGSLVADRYIPLPDNVSSEELMIPADAEPGQVTARQECTYIPSGPTPVWAIAAFMFRPFVLQLP